MTPNSQVAFVADLVRRENSALRARVRALMDADSIPSLAGVSTRTTFAIAAATLLNEIKSALGFGWQESPGFALHSDPSVRAYRIAVTFRVITSSDWLRPFVIEDIRRVANGRSRTLAMRGRIALACLGEIDWRKASRPERAAFVYGQILLGARA